VIFDLSNPEAPTRVAYYDTFDNTTYTGYNGCWGVYPYFPSGNIIAHLNKLLIGEGFVDLTVPIQEINVQTLIKMAFLPN